MGEVVQFRPRKTSVFLSSESGEAQVIDFYTRTERRFWEEADETIPDKARRYGNCLQEGAKMISAIADYPENIELVDRKTLEEIIRQLSKSYNHLIDSRDQD